MKQVFVVSTFFAIAVAVRLTARPPAPHPVAPPAVENGTAIARGRTVYAQYGCAACHGADGKGGFSNPNAETEGKVPAVIYVAEGYTRGELRRKILDGLATIGKADPKGPRPPYRMPGWVGQMTDAETAALVEFLFSLYPKSETQKWR